MSWHPTDVRFEPIDPSRKQLEKAARTAISSQLGRTLSDAEWIRMRGRLMEFVEILRSWARASEEPAESSWSARDRAA